MKVSTYLWNEIGEFEHVKSLENEKFEVRRFESFEM